MLKGLELRTRSRTSQTPLIRSQSQMPPKDNVPQKKLDSKDLQPVRRRASTDNLPLKNFEDLLTSSDCPQMLAFYMFLKSNHSDENLMFFRATNEYKECNSENRKTIAKRIYNTYLRKNALKQINVDHECVNLIEDAITTDNFLPNIFDRAQIEVMNYLKNLYYLRYMQSNYFIRNNQNKMEATETSS